MSLKERVQVECPFCKTVFEEELYSSINVTLDPKLREKIIKMTIYDCKCPKCGRTHVYPIPLIYHDMERKYMIFAGPEDWVFEQYSLAQNSSMKLLGDMGYRFYGALSTDTLQERIVALDHGYDPKIIELMKIYTKLNHKEAEEKDPKILPIKNVFLSEEDGVAFFDVIEEDSNGEEYSQRIDFTKEDYEGFSEPFMEAISKNKDILFEDKYLKPFLDSLEVE